MCIHVLKITLGYLLIAEIIGMAQPAPNGQHTTLSPITYAMQGKVPYYRLWAPEQGGFGGVATPPW